MPPPTKDGEVAECEEKLTELSTRLSAQKEEIVQLNQELSEITARCQEVQNDAEEVAGSMEELRVRGGREGGGARVTYKLSVFWS